MVDVAVLGAGPGGAAAAIALCGRGRSVALIDRAPSSPAVGEALPPEATPLLQQLGVWEAFTACRHAPAVCNESAWGSAALTATSFINTAYGRGWHLDRPAFDALLRHRARDAGTRAVDGRVRRITRGESWELTIESVHEHRSSLTARWVVDATGRPSWLAAQLGVRRIHVGQLTASAVMFHRGADQPADPDRTTLVETSPSGWFYTAPLPESRRIAVCFTRPADAPRSQGRFLVLSAVTVHVRARLAGYDPTAGPWLFAANSSSLERSTGRGWIAVGDAACAHDPVSSYGIVSALATGTRAATAIDAALEGRMAALTAFELRLRSDFEKYLKMLKEVYAMERRWPVSEFWRQ
jgi:flavin-dependent dehydrogenase